MRIIVPDLCCIFVAMVMDQVLVVHLIQMWRLSFNMGSFCRLYCVWYTYPENYNNKWMNRTTYDKWLQNTYHISYRWDVKELKFFSNFIVMIIESNLYTHSLRNNEQRYVCMRVWVCTIHYSVSIDQNRTFLFKKYKFKKKHNFFYVSTIDIV